MNKPENSAFVKFLKGHSTDDESQVIQTWIEQSPENEQEFEKLKSIWTSYEDRSVDFQPDLSEAWNKIEQRVNSESKFTISPWLYRIAAMLVLGLGIAYLMVDENEATLAQTSNVEAAKVIAQNEIREVSLPDGSIVSLNKGASISYESDFGGKDRHVQLQGEAFFDIQRDESKPFIITTQATTTEVLGTSFSINPTSESVIVTVVSGRVSFEGSGNGVILTKGEKGNYSALTNSISESANDDPNFLSWKTKQLLFEDAPFATVTRDLERHYGVEFVTENSSVRKLTASFDDQTLEEVIAVIAATLDITIERNAEGKHIIL
ncbi:MAG: FecR domain-containing protein [Cyclobacteriaceae bacterium]